MAKGQVRSSTWKVLQNFLTNGFEKYKSNTDTRARGSGKCVKVSLHDKHSMTVVIMIYVNNESHFIVMVAWLKLVSNCWMVCCPTIKGFVQRSVPNSGGMVCIGLSLLVTNMVHGVGSLAPLWGGTSA